MPFERAEFLARRRVPHLDHIIETSGDNPTAVKAEPYAADRTCVALERANYLPRRCVP